MPKDFKGNEPVGWFTANGVHLPIFEGETEETALARVKANWQKSPMKFYTSFGSNVDRATKQALKFFKNDENSNFVDWEESLDWNQRGSIAQYTEDEGSYTYINKDLNTIGYSKLDNITKKEVDDIDSAIASFGLYQRIQTTRQADFRMLGFDKTDKPSRSKIISKLEQSFGYMDFKAYLSSSCDEVGRTVNAHGVTVHIQVPPSIGAGAYINHKRLSHIGSENEFLFARNSVLKYDINSLAVKAGVFHINAEWIGSYDDE